MLYVKSQIQMTNVLLQAYPLGTNKIPNFKSVFGFEVLSHLFVIEILTFEFNCYFTTANPLFCQPGMAVRIT